MATRVGINGFGRIGRQVTKAVFERYPDQIEVVAVNDLTDDESLAHLLKYDSIYGRFPGSVEARNGEIIINGKHVKSLEIRDPAQLPWADLGAEVVLESTGIFVDPQRAGAHLSAGAQKVIISAPAKGSAENLVTVVLGVNDDAYDPAKHHLISNASCTTNCLAPLAKVLHDWAGIVSGVMTTIHSYTNDQRILDLPHQDRRRMRAAALNLIPTTTGAAKAIGLVIPELQGKLDGLAIRVPTPTGSLVDLTVKVKDAGKCTVDAINEAYEKAATEGPLAPYLDYSDDDIVLTDIVACPASCIYDAGTTYVIDDIVKVMGWYDNEWGYSTRVADLIVFLAQKGI